MMIATIPPTAGIAEGRVPLIEREIPVNIKAGIHHITKNRMVFNMYAIEGYSHKEIADKLEISIGTSKSQLSRARAYLKNIIIEEEAKEFNVKTV